MPPRTRQSEVSNCYFPFPSVPAINPPYQLPRFPTYEQYSPTIINVNVTIVVNSIEEASDEKVAEKVKEKLLKNIDKMKLSDLI